MATAKKSQGNLGFTNEIASVQANHQGKPAKAVTTANKQFKYSKPVVPKSTQSEAMNTPRRLARQQPALPGSNKSTLCQEQLNHIKKRQGR